MIALGDLQAAIAAGDGARVQSLALGLLTKLSPSGHLVDLSEVAEASKKLDELTAEFNETEKTLAYLNDESLANRIEDDIALAAPAIGDGALILENYAIPVLSALVGPGAPLLSFGLTVACKLALAIFQKWAANRLAAKNAKK